MKKKIIIFSGAGVSAESGIETFRSGSGALWCNYNLEEVATANAWKTNKEKVLEFYNERRKQLKEVEPNLAHKIIAELEQTYIVDVVTQNVDNLHERAGSSNVIHLHGELLKSRSTLDNSIIYDCHGDIKIGDKCELGSQLRPHIVFFGEFLNFDTLEKVKNLTSEADICIIIGTSMQVSPANELPFYTKENTPIYYIDPGDYDYDGVKNFNHYKTVASIGMLRIKQDLNL